MLFSEQDVEEELKVERVAVNDLRAYPTREKLHTRQE